jgi:hypothetical protein
MSFTTSLIWEPVRHEEQGGVWQLRGGDHLREGARCANWRLRAGERRSWVWVAEQPSFWSPGAHAVAFGDLADGCS